MIFYQHSEALNEFSENEFVEEGKPKLIDSNLKISTVANGLNTPTTMAFIGQDDILVLEKDTGIIKRIVNGTVLAKPILDVNMANSV